VAQSGRRGMTLYRKATSFVLVGCLATAIQYVILAILVRLGWNAAVASGTGFVINVSIGYWMNYQFTWSSGKNHRETMTKYLVSCLVGLCLNISIVYVLTSIGLFYLLAQVIATGLTMFFNFFSNDLWTFRVASRSSP
jgi:putative flippase GtrA